MIELCAFADEAASSLYGQIEALHRNRIPYMELRGIDGRNVKDFSLAAAERYARELEREGIRVFSIGSPIGKSDIREDFALCRKDARHIFTLANIFGAKRVRIFSFFHAHGARNEVISRLQVLVEDAEEFGLTLCHENEKDIYGDSAERVLDLLENVPRLASVYDPANFIQVGERADKTLPLLHHRSEYFHIKDVIAETGELVPAGEGDGQITRLLAMIEDDKVLTLEPHLALFDGYSAIDGTKMQHRYTFRTPDEAFDAASNALRSLLLQAGYHETEGGFIR